MFLFSQIFLALILAIPFWLIFNCRDQLQKRLNKKLYTQDQKLISKLFKNLMISFEVIWISALLIQQWLVFRLTADFNFIDVSVLGDLALFCQYINQLIPTLYVITVIIDICFSAVFYLKNSRTIKK